MAKKPEFEVEIRPSGRGGYEIAEIGAPIGMGVGNYPLDQAIYVASCNYERDRIKVIEETPTATAKKGGA